MFRSAAVRCVRQSLQVERRDLSLSAYNPAKIGFIGLGNMGAPMANNLLEKGHEMVVYDVNANATQNAACKGATVVASPAEVADQAESIVTMLPNSQHCQEAYIGENGILSKVRKGTLLLDSSTIDPGVSQHIADESKSHGAQYMDCPVSGGVNAAKAGILTFMVGGPESEFEAAKVILGTMGKNIVYCGDVGAGQAAKICNNMLLAISMIGTAETMNLGVRLGLDPKLLAQVLNSSSGRCWSSELYNPCPDVLPNVPSSNGYKGGFGTALMTKDLGLASSAAQETSSSTLLGNMAYSIYRLMCSHGYSAKDFSSVYRFIQDQKQ